MCIVNSDEYKAHLHPVVLDTFFDTNRKKLKQNVCIAQK